MQERFKIEFRPKQLYLDNDPLQPVVVQGNPDGSAEYVPGLIPGYVWTDMTSDVNGLDDIKINWRSSGSDGDANNTTENGSNYQKGLSIDLEMFGAAFKYVYNFLMLEPYQALNSIEIRITDLICQKTFRLFELKLDNVDYNEEDDCILNVPLREADSVIHSFQKTPIEDDWQGWFNRKGNSTKFHPTFQMIIEKKPKFFLSVYVALIYIAGILSSGALIALTEGKKWISKCLGITYFCPSPYLRTYIQNICQKYGYTYNTMFDDKVANIYRDVCFFWPASSSLKQFNGGNYNAPNTRFIWDNRSVLPFSKFLDQLKKVFNAEWYVTPNNELVFQPKEYFQEAAPIYDFTINGELNDLGYTFNGNKKPAYGNYQYLVDPQDTCSNELKWRYNDYVDYDGPANNPMLEGDVTKTFDFASTSFHNDGSSEDFLEEAIRLGRVIAVSAVVVGMVKFFAAANPLTVAIVAGLLTAGYLVTNNYMNDYFNNDNLNGMVRLSNSEINVPRLLLHDRATPFERAKVVSRTNPLINPTYNLEGINYYQEHPTKDGVGGVFGGSVTKVWNYDMYVDANFRNNLYDRFHEIDNPLFNPEINQSWEANVDLCCEMMDLLGAWEGDFIKIGSVVIIANRGTRQIKGRIESIDVDYSTGLINLKGTVIK